MVAPAKIYPLEATVLTLFGKRVYSCNDVKYLRWDHPGLEWALSLMINVLRREQEETQMRRSCDNRSRDWIMQPQVKE